MSTFDNAAAAPRGLLYLAIFSSRERDTIASSPELQSAIRKSDPCEWPAIVERHRAARRVALMQPKSGHGSCDLTRDRQRRYAEAIGN
jgi:hypothetical protein